MNCKQYHEALLSSLNTEEARAHLESCPACQSKQLHLASTLNTFNEDLHMFVSHSQSPPVLATHTNRGKSLLLVALALFVAGTVFHQTAKTTSPLSMTASGFWSPSSVSSVDPAVVAFLNRNRMTHRLDHTDEEWEQRAAYLHPHADKAIRLGDESEAALFILMETGRSADNARLEVMPYVQEFQGKQDMYYYCHALELIKKNPALYAEALLFADEFFRLVFLPEVRRP